MLKVNNRNTGKSREICSKLSIKIPERRHCRCSVFFIVNFEHVIVFSIVSIVRCKQVNVGWVNLQQTNRSSKLLIKTRLMCSKFECTKSAIRNNDNLNNVDVNQPAFKCSKLTIETLKKV